MAAGTIGCRRCDLRGLHLALAIGRADLDLVLTEGYKKEPLPKVEIFRSSIHSKPLEDPGGNIIAMVSDVRTNLDIPHFGLDDGMGLARFIEEKIIRPAAKGFS